MIRHSLILVTVAATAIGAGCNRPAADRASRDVEKTTPTVSETERPGTQAPSDIAPTTAMARVADLELGSALGPNGDIAEGSQRDDFAPGEPIFVAFEVGDVGTGSAVKAVWKGPDDLRLHEEVKTVAAGSTHLSFAAPSTKSWVPGNFEVEIYLGDEEGGSESFEIKAPART
jgi:hypothetical protein